MNWANWVIGGSFLSAVLVIYIGVFFSHIAETWKPLKGNWQTYLVGVIRLGLILFLVWCAWLAFQGFRSADIPEDFNMGETFPY
jgi:hypothetical protein